MNVVVDGLMANYQKTGSGNKTLVFLHGWGDSSATFRDLTERLQHNYQIISLDLPGFGGSQAPATAWGLQDYVSFIGAWMQKIDTGKIFAFIGHSYGGAILIKGLGEGTLKSEKLVLLASAGIRGQDKLKKRAMWAVAKGAKLPLLVLPKSKRQAVRQKAYKKIGSDMLLLPHMQETFKRIITEDVRPFAGNISIPTLLVYGSADDQTPPSYGQALQEAIKGSRLEIIGAAGHFLHKDQPEKIATLIKNFLAGQND